MSDVFVFVPYLIYRFTKKFFYDNKKIQAQAFKKMPKP